MATSTWEPGVKPAGPTPCPVRGDAGFTLVEVLTTVIILLVVLTAAWTLLTSTSVDLNRIQYGGQASELNRQALAEFQRDVDHAVELRDGQSPVLVDQPRVCEMASDVDGDGIPELVNWTADDTDHDLMRVVTKASTSKPLEIGDFGGASTTSTVVEGLSDTSADTMFTYATAASDFAAGESGQAPDVTQVGLVTLRLRNSLGPVDSKVAVDRTVSCRLTIFAINAGNGY